MLGLRSVIAVAMVLLIVPDVMMAFSDHGGDDPLRLRLTDARGCAISEVDCMTL